MSCEYEASLLTASGDRINSPVIWLDVCASRLPLDESPLRNPPRRPPRDQQRCPPRRYRQIASPPVRVGPLLPLSRSASWTRGLTTSAGRPSLTQSGWAPWSGLRRTSPSTWRARRSSTLSRNPSSHRYLLSPPSARLPSREVAVWDLAWKPPTTTPSQTLAQPPPNGRISTWRSWRTSWTAPPHPRGPPRGCLTKSGHVAGLRFAHPSCRNLDFVPLQTRSRYPLPRKVDTVHREATWTWVAGCWRRGRARLMVSAHRCTPPTAPQTFAACAMASQWERPAVAALLHHHCRPSLAPRPWLLVTMLPAPLKERHYLVLRSWNWAVLWPAGPPAPLQVRPEWPLRSGRCRRGALLQLLWAGSRGAGERRCGKLRPSELWHRVAQLS